MRYVLVAGLLLLVASNASAEVMDKELSVTDIWSSLAVPLGLAVGAALANQWLLVGSFLASLVLGPTFAWTEWHDPFAGPAIAREAGVAYGLHANMAMSTLVGAHLVCWGFASRRRRLRLQRNGSWSTSTAARARVHAIIFMLFVTLLLALAGTTGFSATARILASPPMLVAAAGLLLAVGQWVRIRSQRVGANS